MDRSNQKGYLQSCPGITEEAVKKHPPKIQATELENLYQTRKNKWSTQPTKDENTYKNYLPTTPESLHRYNTVATHFIFEAIETWDVSTLTKQVGFRSIQVRAKNTSAYYMTIIIIQY